MKQPRTECFGKLGRPFPVNNDGAPLKRVGLAGHDGERRPFPVNNDGAPLKH